MNITIIGLGLIGGSMGLALKEKGLAKKVVGVDNNLVHQRMLFKKITLCFGINYPFFINLRLMKLLHSILKQYFSFFFKKRFIL